MVSNQFLFSPLSSAAGSVGAIRGDVKSQRPQIRIQTTEANRTPSMKHSKQNFTDVGSVQNWSRQTNLIHHAGGYVVGLAS